MRKNDSTSAPRVRREAGEPLRQWVNLPISSERACELVDLITRREDGEGRDALIELICGLMPCVSPEDGETLDERRLAGHAALMHAFAETNRAANELGAYVVGLRCAAWE